MAKILICDDSEFMRDFISEVLTAGGHEVVYGARSAKEAIEQYKKHKPDIVTMDLLMEDSGVEAIKGIIKFDKGAKIVIVSVLSEQEEMVVSGIKAGALGIVAKPIKKEALMSEVERVLKM